MRAICIGTAVCVLSVTVPAWGGPYEDGLAFFDKKDYASAARAFADGAAQGDARAQFDLGFLYELGVGVKQDYTLAAQWLTLSANQGNAAGEDSLGDLYANGTGETQSWSEALRYYQMSATQGNQWAEKSIGDIYYYGRGGIPQNYKEALFWYLQSANQGDSDAQYFAGYMYYFGNGMDHNYAEAVSWFKRAADQQHAAAQVYLGLAYDTGSGVPQDYQTAVKYYQLGAHQGNLSGLALLGEKYLNGQGVDKDFSKAYLYLNLATSQISNDMQKSVGGERDAAAAKLTPAQLAAAQVAARQCLASNFTQCEIDGPPAPSGVGAHQPPKAADRIANSALAAPSSHRAPQLFATGSGFFVSAVGHVVTNAHVVSGCPQVRIAAEPAKVVTIDTQSDLALLSTSKPNLTFAKLRGGRGDKLGEAIVAVGFPLHGVLGADPIITTGVVSSLSGLSNDRRNIQISAPVQPGNSGGPALGEDGAVVGVVVAKLDAIKVAGAIGDIPQNVNFAVGVGTLQSFLNAKGVPYTLSDLAPTTTRSTSGIAAEASRYTVSVECWK